MVRKTLADTMQDTVDTLQVADRLYADKPYLGYHLAIWQAKQSPRLVDTRTGKCTLILGFPIR